MRYLRIRESSKAVPLSPLLFNLAIEGLLRGIQVSSSQGYSLSEELEVKALAYADDLAIAVSSEDIATMLVRLEEFSSWAKL